jgi:endonuclease/exonuclease/phosphatase family metal-dependent hydrolase
VPGFGKPKTFDYAVDVPRERRALRAQKKTRGIPARDDEHLLLATWNIANLGAPDQVREPDCFELLAEIVGWFDLVAIQEIRDNVRDGIRQVHALLPDSWRLLFSEDDGNHERMGFLWDSDVVRSGELAGKAVVEPKRLKSAGGKDFLGFSRTPYIGTFHRDDLALLIVSVHSIFGEARNEVDMRRRLAETKAIGWWCKEESKSPHAYTPDILAVGDFNTPSEDDLELAEAMLAELRRQGLWTPRYVKADGEETVLETQVGSAVRSENHYDQLLFFPKDTEADIANRGVFDFDATIFRDLWESRGRKDFNDYTIWAISDHRPLWAQFRLP